MTTPVCAGGGRAAHCSTVLPPVSAMPTAFRPVLMGAEASTSAPSTPVAPATISLGRMGGAGLARSDDSSACVSRLDRRGSCGDIGI